MSAPRVPAGKVNIGMTPHGLAGHREGRPVSAVATFSDYDLEVLCTLYPDGNATITVDPTNVRVLTDAFALDLMPGDTIAIHVEP